MTARKPAAHVVLGLERLLHERLDLLGDARIGLVCNQATVDHSLRHAADLVHAHPRVRLSPHISWSAPDTMQRTIALFAENLRRYRAGQPLQGLEPFLEPPGPPPQRLLSHATKERLNARPTCSSMRPSASAAPSPEPASATPPPVRHAERDVATP